MLNGSLSELLVIMMWIGLWGIIENIIDKFVPYNNYCLRISIFAVIFCVAFLLLKKLAPKREFSAV